MSTVAFWLYSPKNRAGNKPHPLTVSRRDRILDLWAAGNTIDTICYITHLSQDAVSDHLAAGRKAGDARAVLRHVATIKAIAKSSDDAVLEYHTPDEATK